MINTKDFIDFRLLLFKYYDDLGLTVNDVLVVETAKYLLNKGEKKISATLVGNILCLSKAVIQNSIDSLEKKTYLINNDLDNIKPASFKYLDEQLYAYIYNDFKTNIDLSYAEMETQVLKREIETSASESGKKKSKIN